MSNRQTVSKIFYALAIVISLINFFAIVAMHWNTIVDGRGLGSFAVLWALLYIVITVVFWTIAVLLHRDDRLSVVYWSSVAMALLLFALLPVKFYIGE